MFLFNISPLPSQNNDKLINSLVKANVKGDIFAKLLEPAKKQSPPSPGFATTLINNINNILIPKLNEAKALIFAAATNEKSTILTAKEIATIKKAASYQLPMLGLLLAKICEPETSRLFKRDMEKGLAKLFENMEKKENIAVTKIPGTRGLNA